MKNQAVSNTMEKFQGLDPKVLPLLWGGALAAFLVVDLLFVMVPQWNGVMTLCKNVGQIRQDIDMLVANKQRMAQLMKQRDELTRQIADFDRMVYLRDDLPRVLQKISSQANRDGIQIDQLLPQKEGQNLLCEDQGKKYYAMPVLIQARGGFLKFEKFLNHLEQTRVFWQVDSFFIMVDAQYPQRYQVKILIKVIVLDKG